MESLPKKYTEPAEKLEKENHDGFEAYRNLPKEVQKELYEMTKEYLNSHDGHHPGTDEMQLQIEKLAKDGKVPINLMDELLLATLALYVANETGSVFNKMRSMRSGKW